MFSISFIRLEKMLKIHAIKTTGHCRQQNFTFCREKRQLINKNIKKKGPQYRPLWNATYNISPVNKCEIYFNFLYTIS